MPVLVTGAHTSVGERIVRRILAEGGEVRAFGAGVGGSLRAAGAIVANADADDEGRLEAALEQVHTVVHPGASLLGDGGVPGDVAAATLATAATNAGVQRIIGLSVLGAGAGDAFRRLKGRDEDLLAAASVPTVIVRTGLVVTAEIVSWLQALPADDPVAALVHAPLHPDDLLDVIAGLDDLRSTAQEGHVVFHAVGPETMSLGDWLGDTHGQARSTGSRVGSVYRPVDEDSVLMQALRTDRWVPGDGDGVDVFDFLARARRPVGA